jgi:hypothetical protein
MSAGSRRWISTSWAPTTRSSMLECNTCWTAWCSRCKRTRLASSSVSDAHLQSALLTLVPATQMSSRRSSRDGGASSRAPFRRSSRASCKTASWSSSTEAGVSVPIHATGSLHFESCLRAGMHDEAAAHYISMIDQTSTGHRFLMQEFGVTPRVGWQIGA